MKKKVNIGSQLNIFRFWGFTQNFCSDAKLKNCFPLTIVAKIWPTRSTCQEVDVSGNLLVYSLQSCP